MKRQYKNQAFCCCIFCKILHFKMFSLYFGYKIIEAKMMCMCKKKKCAQISSLSLFVCRRQANGSWQARSSPPPGTSPPHSDQSDNSDWSTPAPTHNSTPPPPPPSSATFARQKDWGVTKTERMTSHSLPHSVALLFIFPSWLLCFVLFCFFCFLEWRWKFVSCACRVWFLINIAIRGCYFSTNIWSVFVCMYRLHSSGLKHTKSST